jgi:opacity protein-like surface antigen
MRIHTSARQFVLSAALLGVVSGTVSADGMQRVDVFGGLAIPTRANDYSVSHKVGPLAGATYLFQLSPALSVGGEYTYLVAPGKSRTITSSAARIDAKTTGQSHIFEAVARYALMPEAKVRPFVGAGLGFNRYEEKTKAAPSGTGTWADTSTTEERTVAKASSAGFSASLYGGAETTFQDTWLLGLQAGWQFLGVSDSKFGTSVLNVPTVKARIGWLFGK